ncbi:MAG: hypothetical protein K9J37_09800 [Saprospiraceae bacterium]|nr:hypothetical protein [Saprospiraceae bacterium]MCF8250197.1 hypothetical protein [Saprospiraceae bacterium]MCF8280040.1 hypothetical protein [Bacteroidales bacterium]MCF8312005.1 hypothetical protein [Saprospiraceae bacterium]MCF8441102.1 hypothetical protein [Saprospiraceae bacterium]
MKNNQTYRQTTALLLAFLVLQVVMLKEFHGFFDSHHHVQVAHCDDTKQGESHLHNEEYAPNDCAICFFNLAPATLDFQEFSAQTPVCLPLRKPFFYQETLSNRVNWHFQLRGPPAMAA